MFAISYPIWNIGRTGILEDLLSFGGLHVSIFSSLGFSDEPFYLCIPEFYKVYSHALVRLFA